MAWRRLRFRGRTFWLDENSLEVKEGEEPPALPPAPEFRHRKAPVRQRPSMLVFNLTHRCNLACGYCFVRHTYPEELPVMPQETALKALRLLEPGRDFGVSFFGGEPLLAWPLLQAVTEAALSAAEHSGVRARLHLTTNGTLLDDAKARWLDERGFSLIVSLDGPREIHDGARPFRRGGGSFDAVMRGLEAVKGRPGLAGRTTLRGTFDASRLALAERVEFLNGLCDEGFAGNVSVEPASLAQEGCAALPEGRPDAFSPADCKALRKEYDTLADWWLARERSGKTPRFFHFRKMLDRLERKRPVCSDCGAGWGYAAVNPAGEIHACHREGNAIGNVREGFDEAARARWLDNRYYARDRCPRCWARNLCGGGCRKDSWDKFGDIARTDPLACFLRKTWLLEAMHIASSRKKPAGHPASPDRTPPPRAPVPASAGTTPGWF